MRTKSNELSSMTGYSIPNNELAYWVQIIEEWILLIDRYCRIEEEDAPYWYTERTNIGLMAGACWRAGYISLEEFQWEKGHSNQPKWSGRADLWLANENHQALIEAKLKWLSLNSTDPIKIIKETLELAWGEAKVSKGKQKMDALGLAFIPIYVKESKRKETDILISDFTKRVTLKFKDDLMFWHFPSATRSLAGKNNNICPGIFCIARRV